MRASWVRNGFRYWQLKTGGAEVVASVPSSYATPYAPPAHAKFEVYSVKEGLASFLGYAEGQHAARLHACFARVFLAALACLALLVVGCDWNSMTTRPTVFVDESFGADLPDVVAGARAWPGIEPQVVVLPRADLLALAGPGSGSAAPNTVYLVESSTAQQVGCPWAGHDPNLGNEVSVTREAANGSALICVATDYARQHPQRDPADSSVRHAAAHEFGHALRLRFDAADPTHCPTDGRLMSADYYGPSEPTADDLAALRARFPELAR